MPVSLSVLEALQLRPFATLAEDEHLQILEIRNEESVRTAMFTSHRISPDEHMKWVTRIADNTAVEMFAVTYAGQLVGAVGLTEYDRSNQRANWAYYLTDKVRGQGVGIAGEFAFIDHVFTVLGLEKLNGEVLEFNVRVLKLHGRFGFVHEGVRRKHIRRDDRWLDCVLIGLTREEWIGQRDAVRSALFN